MSGGAKYAPIIISAAAHRANDADRGNTMQQRHDAAKSGQNENKTRGAGNSRQAPPASCFDVAPQQGNHDRDQPHAGRPFGAAPGTESATTTAPAAVSPALTGGLPLWPRTASPTDAAPTLAAGAQQHHHLHLPRPSVSSVDEGPLSRVSIAWRDSTGSMPSFNLAEAVFGGAVSSTPVNDAQ